MHKRIVSDNKKPFMKILTAYPWEEPHGWNEGGIITYEEISQSIRVTHLAKIIIIYEEGDMTTEERIDEMCRQWLTTESEKKKRDLKKGIARAERKRRKEKLEKEGCIIL